MAKYLVTGAAGFIGSNIVEELLNNDKQVIGLDNFFSGKKENLDFVSTHPNKNNFTFIEGDIRSIDTCHKTCQEIDYVIHQAAMGSVPRSINEPALYNENNVTGTLNLLIAARDEKIKRFVFASSSSVYGDTKVLPKVETMTPQPKSPYAVTKAAGEYYTKVFNDVYGLETITFRYFNVFGPKQDPNSQYAAVIPNFMTTFINNTSPTIYGDGEQTRDFTFVKNVVDINLKACEVGEKACGRVYNVGCGGQISVNKLANIIKKLTESDKSPLYAKPRPGDVKDSMADITLLKKYLEINSLINLEQGLEETIKWYRQNSLNMYNRKYGTS